MNNVLELAREAGIRLDKHNGGFVNQNEFKRFYDLAIASVYKAHDIHKAASDKIIASLEAENAMLYEKLDALLAHCPDGECMTCGEIICEHKDPMHFHHDGCPSCELGETND